MQAKRMELEQNPTARVVIEDLVGGWYVEVAQDDDTGRWFATIVNAEHGVWEQTDPMFATAGEAETAARRVILNRR